MKAWAHESDFSISCCSHQISSLIFLKDTLRLQFNLIPFAFSSTHYTNIRCIGGTIVCSVRVQILPQVKSGGHEQEAKEIMGLEQVVREEDGSVSLAALQMGALCVKKLFWKTTTWLPVLSLLLDENLPCDVCYISDPLLVDTWLVSQAELHFLQQQLSETAAVLVTGREQLELSSAFCPTSDQQVSGSTEKPPLASPRCRSNHNDFPQR